MYRPKPVVGIPAPRDGMCNASPTPHLPKQSCTKPAVVHVAALIASVDGRQGEPSEDEHAVSLLACLDHVGIARDTGTYVGEHEIGADHNACLHPKRVMGIDDERRLICVVPGR